MKNKQLLIGLGIIILLVAAVYYFISGNKTNTLKKELTNFAVKDTASITKIFMADKRGKQVTLERVNSNEWKVNGKYPAKTSSMKILLETMHGISVKSTVPKTAFNNVVKRMAAEAVKVEIYQKGSLSKTYYVGGTTIDFYGTYMMLENSSTPFVMWLQGFEGFLNTRYFTDENLWRSNYFFTQLPYEFTHIKIEYPRNPELSFDLGIAHPQTDKRLVSFSLTSPQSGKTINFDTAMVKAYLLEFKSIAFEIVSDKMNPNTKDSTLTLEPLHLITVEDLKGNKMEFKTFPRKGNDGDLDEKGYQLKYDPDRFYVQLNQEPNLFMAQYHVFDKILKPITYFEK